MEKDSFLDIIISKIDQTSFILEIIIGAFFVGSYINLINELIKHSKNYLWFSLLSIIFIVFIFFLLKIYFILKELESITLKTKENPHNLEKFHKTIDKTIFSFYIEFAPILFILSVFYFIFLFKYIESNILTSCLELWNPMNLIITVLIFEGYLIYKIYNLKKILSQY